MFWKTKSLKEMTSKEWELLCDRCGKCCVVKLEDYDTKEIYYTNVSCKLLCEKTALCKDYINRKTLVPDCKICAYKILDKGGQLPNWHPLICGNNEEIVKSGNSVKNKVTSEVKIKQKNLPNFIYDW